MEHRLQGVRLLGSVIVAHRLSYSPACGIFPGQESNPCILHWQAGFLLLSHQGSLLMLNLILGQLGTSGLGYIGIFEANPYNPFCKNFPGMP